MTELKPCPFCGGDNCKLKINDEIGVYVFCPDCGISAGEYANWEDEVIEMWNRRIGDARN